MSRYPRRNLSKVLDQHTIDEARDDLVQIDGELALVPEHARETFYNTVEALVEHAQRFGWTTMHEVLENVGPILDGTSGVRREDHSRFLTFERAESLHLHRNVLLTLLLAGVMSYNGDASQIAAAFPKLKQRTRARLRPHTDDETLLLRMWTLHLSKGDKNNRRAAAVYAQSDTGLVTGETTMVYDTDIDLTPGGAMIEAPGLGDRVDSRILPLDTYATTILVRYIDGADLPAGSRLTYRPRKGGYDYERALPSAIGIIDRVRDAVALTHNDTTNASVWMWRAATTELLHGINAAVELTGRSSADNLRALLRDRPTRPGRRPVSKRRKTLAIA